MTFKLAWSYKGITNYTREVTSAKHGIYKERVLMLITFMFTVFHNQS